MSCNTCKSNKAITIKILNEANRIYNNALNEANTVAPSTQENIKNCLKEMVNLFFAQADKKQFEEVAKKYANKEVEEAKKRITIPKLGNLPSPIQSKANAFVQKYDLENKKFSNIEEFQAFYNSTKNAFSNEEVKSLLSFIQPLKIGIEKSLKETLGTSSALFFIVIPEKAKILYLTNLAAAEVQQDKKAQIRENNNIINLRILNEIFPDETPLYYPKEDKLDPKYKEEMLDFGHIALDIIGVFDPFGIADGTNFLWYMNEYLKENSEDKKNQIALSASMSLLGAVLPYAGDLMKAGKIGVRIKLASSVLEKIKSIVPQRFKKAHSFLDKVAEKLSNPERIEKIAVGTGLTATEIARKSLVDITKHIIEKSLESPLSFIKSFKITGPEAALIRKNYAKITAMQGIIYFVLASKAGLDFLNFLISLPPMLIKDVMTAIYSSKDIDTAIEYLSKSENFAEDPTSKINILSKFRNVLVPFYREVQDQIEKKIREDLNKGPAEIEPHSRYGYSNKPLEENNKNSKIKISIIDNQILKEGKGEYIEKILAKMSKLVNVEELKSVLKEIDEILPKIITKEDIEILFRKTNDLITIRETDIRSANKLLESLQIRLGDLNAKELSTPGVYKERIEALKERIADTKKAVDLKVQEKTREIEELKNTKKKLEQRKGEIESAEAKVKPKDKQKTPERAGLTAKKWAVGTLVTSVTAWLTAIASEWLCTKLGVIGVTFGTIVFNAIKGTILGAAIGSLFYALSGILGKITGANLAINLGAGGTLVYVYFAAAGALIGGVFGCYRGLKSSISIQAQKILDDAGITDDINLAIEKMALATGVSQEEIKEKYLLISKTGESYFLQSITPFYDESAYGDFANLTAANIPDAWKILITAGDIALSIPEAIDLIKDDEETRNKKRKDAENYLINKLEAKVPKKFINIFSFFTKILSDSGITDAALQKRIIRCSLESVIGQKAETLTRDSTLMKIADIIGLTKEAEESGSDASRLKQAISQKISMFFSETEKLTRKLKQDGTYDAPDFFGIKDHIKNLKLKADFYIDEMQKGDSERKRKAKADLEKSYNEIKLLKEYHLKKSDEFAKKSEEKTTSTGQTRYNKNMADFHLKMNKFYAEILLNTNSFEEFSKKIETSPEQAKKTIKEIGPEEKDCGTIEKENKIAYIVFKGFFKSTSLYEVGGSVINLEDGKIDLRNPKIWDIIEFNYPNKHIKIFDDETNKTIVKDGKSFDEFIRKLVYIDLK